MTESQLLLGFLLITIACIAATWAPILKQNETFRKPTAITVVETKNISKP